MNDQHREVARQIADEWFPTERGKGDLVRRIAAALATTEDEAILEQASQHDMALLDAYARGRASVIGAAQEGVRFTTDEILEGIEPLIKSGVECIQCSRLLAYITDLFYCKADACHRGRAEAKAEADRRFDEIVNEFLAECKSLRADLAAANRRADENLRLAREISDARDTIVEQRDKALDALAALEPYLTTEAQMLDSASLNEGRASSYDTASIKARKVLAEARGCEE